MAPSDVGSSTGATLTGVYDAYLLYTQPSLTSAQKKQRGEELEKQLAILLLAVESAISCLRDSVLVRTIV